MSQCKQQQRLAKEKGGWIEQHHYVGRGEWKVCMDSRSWVDMQRENRMVSKLMGEERGEFFLLFFYAITSHRMVLVLGSVGCFFVKKKQTTLLPSRCK